MADTNTTTDEDQDEDSPVNSETLLTVPYPSVSITIRRSRTPQILAALAATIGAFGLGNVVAWSSPAIPSLQKEKHFGNLTDSEQSWIGSIVTIGAAISSLLAGPAMDWFGRKTTLVSLGLPFIIGWLMVSLSKTIVIMLVGRFICGFCGGAFALLVPAYCSEISETEIRGTLGSSMGLMLCAGILFVNIVGAFVTWFWLSIICTFVPVLFLVCMVFMPETPTYLLMKGEQLKAKKALRWFRGGPSNHVSEELRQIQLSLDETYAQPIEIGKPYILKPFAICLGLMLFQQLSLINVVVFYAVYIFRSAGSTIDANLCSVIVALVQLASAGLSTILIDKAGRKILLIISSAGISITLAVLGTFYYLKQQNNGVAPDNLGFLPLTSLILFIITYNLGYGPLPWVMLSELMSSRVKSYTSALAASFCWILAFLVTKYYVNLEGLLSEAITYWLFAGLSLFGVCFAIFIVPETKGKTLDEIQRLFR